MELALWQDLKGISAGQVEIVIPTGGHGKLLEVPRLAVETLLVGDQVGLKFCPHFKKDPAARFEFGVAETVERETPDCVVVSCENFNPVGYRVGTMLMVSRETFAGRNSID